MDDIEWTTKKTDLINYINDKKISLSINSDCSAVKFIGETGWGRIATKDIPKDKIIARIGGFWVSKEERAEYPDYDYFLYVEGQYYFQGGLHPRLNGSHNHSCDPNAYIEDYMMSRALRDIKKGEEITVDYGTFIDHSDTILKKCKCNSKECRGEITGKDWLTYNLVMKYNMKCSNSIINKWIKYSNYEILFRQLSTNSKNVK